MTPNSRTAEEWTPQTLLDNRDYSYDAEMPALQDFGEFYECRPHSWNSTGHTFSCDVTNSEHIQYLLLLYPDFQITDFHSLVRFMPVHSGRLIPLQIKRTGAEFWSVSALLLFRMWTYCTGSCWLCLFCLITFCSMLNFSPPLSSSTFLSCFHNSSPCYRFSFTFRASFFYPFLSMYWLFLLVQP